MNKINELTKQKEEEFSEIFRGPDGSVINKPDAIAGFITGAMIEAYNISNPEVVICSAVRAPDDKLFLGHRHHNAILTMRTTPGYENDHVWGDDQGFITSRNRYVTRKEGYEIQKEAGIKSYLERIGKPEEAYLNGELYSEDLY